MVSKISLELISIMSILIILSACVHSSSPEDIWSRTVTSVNNVNAYKYDESATTTLPNGLVKETKVHAEIDFDRKIANMSLRGGVNLELHVINGTEFYRYDNYSWEKRKSSFQWDKVKSILDLEESSEIKSIKLSGSERIRGEDCWVLEIVKEVKLGNNTIIEKRREWIAKQGYLPLRREINTVLPDNSTVYDMKVLYDYNS